MPDVEAGVDSIAERTATLATADPQRVLLECVDQFRTASDIEQESNRLAHYFESLGVRADD